jgi:pimeloyl-ACP methyl ester carboxylesterase
MPSAVPVFLFFYFSAFLVRFCMIHTGLGPPLVLVPGIQGRWEWMEPAVQALATRVRVVSYSLCGDRGSGCPLDGASRFENYVRQLDEVFDAAGLERAALCGVSFGGLIALHYAACRPERVSALALVSAPGPRWRPDRRTVGYMRAPRLMAPLFVVRAPLNVAREVAAALPRHRDRWAFSARHLRHILRAPFSPARMAERVTFSQEVDFAADCARVQAPTLVVTGEPHLDRNVPVDSTREYLSCIRGATGVVFERTGHLGLVTRPARFAQIVGDFVDAHLEQARPERRRAM